MRCPHFATYHTHPRGHRSARGFRTPSAQRIHDHPGPVFLFRELSTVPSDRLDRYPPWFTLAPVEPFEFVHIWLRAAADAEERFMIRESTTSSALNSVKPIWRNDGIRVPAIPGHAGASDIATR